MIVEEIRLIPLKFPVEPTKSASPHTSKPQYGIEKTRVFSRESSLNRLTPVSFLYLLLQLGD
jgi:hypothetical protein